MAKISDKTIAGLPNLQPGDEGSNVKTLQSWLVQNGYMTQSQMNTGPGIYGPKTKAAVAAWQKSAGIDPKGNSGYFGPISKSHLSNQGSTTTTTKDSTVTRTPNAANDGGPEWELSEWQQNDDGSFKSKPVLTIDGKRYRFDDPQDYIDKLNEVQAAGSDGPINEMKKQFQGAIEYRTYIENKDGKSNSNNNKDDDDNFGPYDDTALRATDEFQRLSGEDQDAVLAVFEAVAGNDKTKASRLVDAFKAAAKINDPYFAQQLRLAVDAIERGYVTIDEESEFQELQLTSRLSDFREDFERKKDFMTLEQAATLKEIDREYEATLEVLREGLATTGFGSSSRKAKKVGLLDEATGDLRQSSNRRFEFERGSDDINLGRAERDTERELERLARVTEEGKLSFLRDAERNVGTANLPNLAGAPDPLGDIYGAIPEQKLQNTISTATSFVF